MERLEAPGLVLEPLVAAHAREMFALLQDRALYRHLDDEPPESLDWLRGRYTRLESRRSADARQAWLNWVIRGADGSAMGYVQATVEGDGAWVAYVLGSAFQGRGHATHAMAAMLAHLASRHGVTRFLAVVEEANGPSIRLLERLGFRPATEAQRPGHLSATERLYLRESALAA